CAVKLVYHAVVVVVGIVGVGNAIPVAVRLGIDDRGRRHLAPAGVERVGVLPVHHAIVVVVGIGAIGDAIAIVVGLVDGIVGRRADSWIEWIRVLIVDDAVVIVVGVCPIGDAVAIVIWLVEGGGRIAIDPASGIEGGAVGIVGIPVVVIVEIHIVHDAVV